LVVATVTSEDPLPGPARVDRMRPRVGEAGSHAPQAGQGHHLAPDWMRKPGQMVTAMPPPEYTRMVIISD